MVRMAKLSGCSVAEDAVSVVRKAITFWKGRDGGLYSLWRVFLSESYNTSSDGSVHSPCSGGSRAVAAACSSVASLILPAWKDIGASQCSCRACCDLSLLAKLGKNRLLQALINKGHR